MTRRATVLRSRLRSPADSAREIILRGFLAVEMAGGVRVFRCRRCLIEVTRRHPGQSTARGSLLNVLRDHVPACAARPQGADAT